MEWVGEFISRNRSLMEGLGLDCVLVGVGVLTSMNGSLMEGLDCVLVILVVFLDEGKTKLKSGIPAFRSMAQKWASKLT